MGLPTICRCCLAKGMHRDMDVPYIYEGNKEIYLKMLQECFNIALSAQKKTKSICNKCITRLRDAHDFMQQVVYSEEMITTVLQENNVVLAEEETHEMNSEDSLDSLYLNIAEDTPIELESEDENCDNSEDSANLKEEESVKEEEVIRKPSAIKRKPAHTNKSSDNKVSKLTKPLFEKDKQKANLVTILEYSNVLVFKDKSLAGFHCGYCDKTFEDPIDLRSHTDLNHESERLISPSYFKEYPIKLEISNLKCTICNEDIENLQKLKKHLVNSHDKFIYTDIKDYLLPFKFTQSDSFNCIMCTSAYETFKMLKQHMNIHYNNHVCHCGSTFITRRSLNRHKSIHIKGSFKCDFCEKVFSNNFKKGYHEKTSHLGWRANTSCPYCDETFRSYYQRNQHLVKVHNTEAQYKCNICNRGYILKAVLMAHIKKNHMMEKNHACKECGSKFFSGRSLKLHMLMHTGEKKYKCKICKKAYARKTTLREHMRIHNNDRRFKCEKCSSAFVQKCSLRSHLLSHHGIIISANEISATI